MFSYDPNANDIRQRLMLKLFVCIIVVGTFTVLFSLSKCKHQNSGNCKSVMINLFENMRVKLTFGDDTPKKIHVSQLSWYAFV